VAPANYDINPSLPFFPLSLKIIAKYLISKSKQLWHTWLWKTALLDSKDYFAEYMFSRLFFCSSSSSFFPHLQPTKTPVHSERGTRIVA
jgi:hypothetical protein